jgi:hypothetical protein
MRQESTVYVEYHCESKNPGQSRRKKPATGDASYQARIAPPNAYAFTFFTIYTVWVDGPDGNEIKCVSDEEFRTPLYFIDGTVVDLHGDEPFPEAQAKELIAMRDFGRDKAVITRFGDVLFLSEDKQVVNSKSVGEIIRGGSGQP